ncbi:hypothetical protein B7494_g6429 [Chlorociboria aeruginascens]|nr:hypothetical protein B7494_g6429 [Chlorociboria aeruginascens]
MPRSKPHPLALFSLKPYNPRARHDLALPCNSHLVSILPKSGDLVLDVGFNIRSQSHGTLATIGRNGTDIIIQRSGIVRVQCSFEIDLDSKVVMLYDGSNGQTTQVFGDDAIPFEHGRLRRVVVKDDLNTMIGMGGVRCDLVQSELIWHKDSENMIERAKKRKSMPCGQEEENPRLARTVDDAPTVLLSRRMTRVHTAGMQEQGIRYKEIGSALGSGQFGTVYKCVDVDLGKLMAVQVLKQLERSSEQALKREVETLSEISHGWGELKVEIFMGLKEGSLESLIENGRFPPVADRLFYHMLQALDYLTMKGIVHQDVKPENILYTLQPDGQHLFQLGDFGLCNRAVDAATFAGTCIYMAPEINQGENQTHKVDVWSLFVTMLWTLDIGKFQQKDSFRSIAEVRQAILFAASREAKVSKIREMAIVNPQERASAAQMLVKYFGGSGLSTPRNQVPALTSSPPSTTATSRALVPALPSALLVAHTNLRGFRRNENIFAATARYPYRVGKARHSSARQAPRRLRDLRIRQGFQLDTGT